MFLICCLCTALISSIVNAIQPQLFCIFQLNSIFFPIILNFINWCILLALCFPMNYFNFSCFRVLCQKIILNILVQLWFSNKILQTGLLYRRCPQFSMMKTPQPSSWLKWFLVRVCFVFEIITFSLSPHLAGQASISFPVSLNTQVLPYDPP